MFQDKCLGKNLLNRPLIVQEPSPRINRGNYVKLKFLHSKGKLPAKETGSLQNGRRSLTATFKWGLISEFTEGKLKNNKKKPVNQ